jgi:hypothetical protein
VSGTGCPKTDGLTAEVTTVVDVAALTFWKRGPPALGTSVPAYSTVMTWLPPESGTVMVAELWSVGMMCAPRTVSKSGVMIWMLPRVEPPSRN